MLGILSKCLKLLFLMLLCLSFFTFTSCQSNSENILPVQSLPTLIVMSETSSTDSSPAISPIDLESLKQACAQSKYPKTPGIKWTYKVYSEFTQNNATTIKNYTITTTINDNMETVAVCNGDCQTFNGEFAPAEYLICDLPLYGYGKPPNGVTCTTENNTMHCTGNYKNGITDICSTNVTETDETPMGLVKIESFVECPTFKALDKMELVQFEPSPK